MSEDEKKEGSQFKVTDRRLFTSEGDLKERKAEEGPSQPKSEPGVADARPRSVRHEPGTQDEDAASPVDLSSLILSLATTAMVHLGDVRDPSGETSKPDIAAARQMVEIIAMLQRKTEGNRTAEETRLLDDVLYELRMRILSKTGAAHL